MRLLAVHLAEATFTDKQKSSMRDPAYLSVGKQEFHDVLVAFICVESHDDTAIAIESAEELHRICVRCSAHEVSLQPFAHLSHRLAHPKIALTLISSLASHLHKLGTPTTPGSFGFHKSASVVFQLDAHGYGGSISYREFPKPTIEMINT